MRTREEIISKLNAHSGDTPSKWREKAEWRNTNKSWLRYSQRIAMMMLDKMEELGLTQKALAERMGCSQQYASTSKIKNRTAQASRSLCPLKG